ncbi:MAG: hypothetical protein LBT55_07070 [Clostridiaceae bacterium]|jgi:hypothetical protein|nr:hypothetical protein [Clostridiaceae bacterium]
MKSNFLKNDITPGDTVKAENGGEEFVADGDGKRYRADFSFRCAVPGVKIKTRLTVDGKPCTVKYGSDGTGAVTALIPEGSRRIGIACKIGDFNIFLAIFEVIVSAFAGFADRDGRFRLTYRYSCLLNITRDTAFETVFNPYIRKRKRSADYAPTSFTQIEPAVPASFAHNGASAPTAFTRIESPSLASLTQTEPLARTYAQARTDASAIIKVGENSIRSAKWFIALLCLIANGAALWVALWFILSN